VESILSSQHWLSFSLEQFELNKDPNKVMDVFQAIRWGIAAWEQDITNTTIANCWFKSRVSATELGPITRQEAIELGWRESVAEDYALHEEVEAKIVASIQATGKDLGR
jgi:hypothetical protein